MRRPLKRTLPKIMPEEVGAKKTCTKDDTAAKEVMAIPKSKIFTI